ncbi:MAG: hypothetical protein H6742_08005 [Alphaproteobacteria bacterium]|nr:hypothetical protein [Alphaproteobacteria bacterium]
MLPSRRGGPTSFLLLLTGAAWAASVMVTDLGTPVVAGVRLDRCDAALSKRAQAVWGGQREIELRGGHFRKVGFRGGPEGCYAVGGPVTAEGRAALPEPVELVARDGLFVWYTTATPGIYRVRAYDFAGEHELWWVGDWDRWVAERTPTVLAQARAEIASAVALGDLQTAALLADRHALSGADDWNAALAAPLSAALDPRIAELEARRAAGEPPEVIGRALDALIPLVPEARRSALWPFRHALHDDLLARADQAQAAGARATAVGLRYLALVLYPDNDRPTHEALAQAALALAPTLSPLPADARFADRPPRGTGMDAIRAAVLGNQGSVLASFPATLPPSGSRLVVDVPLAVALEAQTTTGERVERVRTAEFRDMRTVLERQAARTQEIRAEERERARACASTQTVATAASSVTRTEQFRESDRLSGITTSGVREVTTTTPGSIETSVVHDVACLTAAQQWATDQLAALGPVPDAFERRETVRTVTMQGEWQTWTGRASRTLRLVAPDGTSTVLVQSEPVALGPYMRATRDGITVDEWRTEAEIRTELEAVFDDALVDQLYDAFDARVARDAAKLAPEWREQEVGWARWFYGDGPAMASVAETHFFKVHSVVAEAASRAWDTALEDKEVQAAVPLGDHRWVASIDDDRIVVLDGRFNRTGLPLRLLVADSGTVMPVPGRRAVVVTDRGMPSVIDLSGPVTSWRRSGPGCAEPASPKGFGPDGRLLVRGKDWSGWWDPTTGSLEKLPAHVGDAWPWLEPGKVLVFGEGGVDLMQVDTGARERLVSTPIQGRLSVREDGRLLAIVNPDRWEVWDLVSGRQTDRGVVGETPDVPAGPPGAFYGDELWLTDGVPPHRIPGYDLHQLFLDPTLRPPAAD